MAGRIIGLFSCLLCALPFFMIAVYNKNSKDPIPFWSGDSTLKGKVANVFPYNQEMAALYKKYALAFLVTGIAFALFPIAGIILLCFDCTLGIYLVYKSYKNILSRYS